MSTLRIHLSNIYRLGVKELNSLWADKVLLFLIIWAFTAGIYSASKGVSQEIHNAPVAIVDLDHSQISQRLANALTKPYFKKPDLIELNQANEALDKGDYSFSIIIPPSFQRDLQAGRKPNVQLNIDATVMSQAFIGSSYIETIFNNEVNEYFNRSAQTSTQPIQLVTHVRFNPNMTGFWFGGVMEVINNINMLTIILVGAAYIREREHGTLEHLLAMPLGPTEIMISKIWANGLAVLIAASFALIFIIKIVLQVPIAGSIALFIAAAAVYLFSGSFHRYLSGNTCPFHAATGPFDLFDHHTAANAVRRLDSPGKYADLGPERHETGSDHLFRPARPIHSLPGCRIQYRLAGISGYRYYRNGFLLHRPRPIQEIDCPGLAGCRFLSARIRFRQTGI